MPERDTRRPADHVTSGTWPNATLDGTPAATYAQHIARNLAHAIEGHSRREIGRKADVADVTVAAILEGRNYPDIRTIARLETALDTSLLPAWPHRKR